MMNKSNLPMLKMPVFLFGCLFLIVSYQQVAVTQDVSLTPTGQPLLFATAFSLRATHPVITHPVSVFAQRQLLPLHLYSENGQCINITTKDGGVDSFSDLDSDVSKKQDSDDERNEDGTQTKQIKFFRNNFGDIMSPTVDDAGVLFRDGLVTSSTHSLKERYDIQHPLDRMAVTANGNLQRLVSSYYDAPVSVVVDFCTPSSKVGPKHMEPASQPQNRTENQADSSDCDIMQNYDASLGYNNTWERRVQLQVFGTTFCTADSHVVVHSQECCKLVESGQVGLGQLFRHLNVLPEFALQAAGPFKEGGFWREYTLICPEVTCEIYERFIPNMWDLRPQEFKFED